ncbi:hypothetical protein [Paenibacillus sp. FSL E2-0190]|uniref:hypothetical protein n=1 Tax=Paenibacillus sp. FSL E2-0190 TaxID=2954504 RepID=UPI0030EBAA03
MEKDVSFLIVRRLIEDMLGRYLIDAVIVKARDREDLNIKVGMYEKWRELISIGLHKNGLIQEPYVAKRNDELKY